MVVIIKNIEKIFALFSYLPRSRFSAERFQLLCDMLLTNSTIYLEPVVRTPNKFNPPVGGLKHLIEDQANWLSNNRLLLLSDLFFILFPRPGI